MPAEENLRPGGRSILAGDAAGNLDGEAFRVSLGGEHRLQMLPRAIATDNNSGDITLEFNFLPYIWTCDGDLHTLPLLPGRTRGRATAINNLGVVAGTMQ